MLALIKLSGDRPTKSRTWPERSRRIFICAREKDETKLSSLFTGALSPPPPKYSL